jgi:hypothetical protein
MFPFSDAFYTVFGKGAVVVMSVVGVLVWLRWILQFVAWLAHR